MRSGSKILIVGKITHFILYVLAVELEENKPVEFMFYVVQNEQKGFRIIVCSLSHVFILQSASKRCWYITRVYNQVFAWEYSFLYVLLLPN